MVPPTNMEAWFVGGPWGPKDVHFHDYWTEVWRGRKEAGSFNRFGSGLHELAHFIWAQDSVVLDPYWGFGEMGDPYKGDTRLEAVISEFACAYIEVRIETHLDVASYVDSERNCLKEESVKWKAGNWYNCTWSFNGSRELSRLPAPMKTRAYRYFIYMFPDIQAIWNELQRKNQLVQSLLA